MVSCCACPVTPNGLASLSARNDLISNTLTPAVPTSIVIKLLSTKPVAGVCNPGTVTSATLVPGLLAWGTTIHPQITSVTTTVPNTSSDCQYKCNPPSSRYASWCKSYCSPKTVTTTTNTYATTDTPFSPALLSAGELATLGNDCTAIQHLGSGFGICRSCQPGAQSPHQ